VCINLLVLLPTPSLLPPHVAAIAAVVIAATVAAAGRRSTDLLHLMLQNLYFMQHVRGYVGEGRGALCACVRPRLLTDG
jgi:hypothetical protein